MALDTYDDLKAAIADWLNRTDLSARVPDFIALTEASLNRDVRTREMVATTSLTMVAGADTMALPADVTEVRNVVLQTSAPVVLESVPSQVIDTRYGAAVSGRPVAFCVVGSTLRLGPPPDAAYGLEVTHYAPIAALSEDAPTNWVLSGHPDLYLYGALVQASPYLGDDARVQTWAALYARALEMLDAADNRAQWAGSPVAMQISSSLP